jgi:hypothetical protein
MRKLLILTGIVASISFGGCNDPSVDREKETAQHLGENFEETEDKEHETVEENLRPDTSERLDNTLEEE